MGQFKDSPFKTNLKYIIRYNPKKKAIEALNLEKQKYLFSQTIDDLSPKIELSPFYYDIFLTVSKNGIKIWKIFEKKKEVKNQTIISLENSDEHFLFAKFSPLNEKVIISVSDDLSIKIWNLEKIFCISEIKDISNTTINNITFSLNDETVIGVYSNENFYLCDISHKKILSTIEKNYIIYSSFIDSEHLIIVNYPETIEIYNFKENKCERTINYQCNGNSEYFYLDGLLYILLGHLTILELNSNKIIKFQNIKYNSGNNEVIFIDNKIDKIKSDLFNLLILNNGEGLLYSFFLNNSFEKKNKNVVKNNSDSFLRNNKRKLYPESELSFNQIQYDQTEIYLKNYFKNENIKKEMISNYKIDLEEKRIDVEKALEQYNPRKILKDEYFQLLSLLIKDNTNKVLISKYLTFLKKNESLLKNGIEIETYCDELNYYNVIFSPKEFKNELNEIKSLSEKEKFIQFLLYIKDISEGNYNLFKNNIDKSKLGRFNQKIDFYKNQELFWFRNRNLLTYAITKLPFERFTNIQFCINQVISRKLLEEQNIVENKNRLSFIIINLVMPLSENVYNYNLNLVSSFDVKSEKEFEGLLIKEGFYEKNGNYYLSTDNNIFLDPKKDKDICIKNYILNKKENLNLSNYQLFNYDKIIENFYLKIDTTRIKNFLSKFLVSNLFKEVYYYLYPDNLIFPFENKNSAEKFINENLNFLPMINEFAHGSTDKFTLEIFIYIDKKEFYNMPKNFDESDKDNILILTGLMTGGLIKTGIHEINHDMYNIYFYHSNGIISLKTPRKTIKGNDLRESGREMELLLFGSEIYQINIKQALYLLNEKNYEKGILEFRKGFIELNDCDLDITGEFSYFSKIKKSKYFRTADYFSISTSTSNDLFLMSSISDNDTL